MAQPPGLHTLQEIKLGLNTEKHKKIFLSETFRPRAMIFGM